jgi:hypothetical protein
MLSLTYTSAVSTPLAEDDIAAILLKSRANNRREGLTGALLFGGDRFVQILEGPDTVVRSRFAVIAADSRHGGIDVLREIDVAERQFPEWTMGFRRSDSAIGSQLPGYEDFMGRPGEMRIVDTDDTVQRYLERIGDYWLAQSR